MIRSLSTSSWSLLLLCPLFIWGCNGSATTETTTPSAPAESSAEGDPEHADPHDVPLTEDEIAKLKADTAQFSAAIEHIQKYVTTIQVETTSGMPAKAHRSLDLLDYVLQWLPEIAQNSNVPKGHWQTIGENAQKLRDAMNKIHENIDAGKEPDYASHAAEIDAAVQALAAVPTE